MSKTDQPAATESESVVWTGLLPAAVGVVAAYWVSFLSGGLRPILCHVPDDAGYFLKIAANLAAGHGLTFDRLHPTNGVQPLWTLVLAALAKVIHTSPETMLRLTLGVQLGLVLAAVLLLHGALARCVGRPAAVLGGAAFLALVPTRAINGMESALLIFSLCALFYFTVVADVFAAVRPGRLLAFGVGLGLVGLARLDSVFFMVAVCVALAAGGPERRRQLGWVLAGCVLVLAPYLAYNKLVFGAFMPISGKLKSSLPHVDWAGLVPRAEGTDRVTRGAVAAAVAYLSWFSLHHRQAPAEQALPRAAVACLGAGVLGHFAHSLLFMRWAAFGWHYISYALFLCGLAAVVAAGVERPRRLLGALGLALLIALQQHAVVSAKFARRQNLWHVLSYDAAVWTRQQTAPDAVLAMKDAGYFGWFSERRVVNLDGLVNSLEYQEALRRQELGSYLRGCQVSYLVQHAFAAGDPHLDQQIRGGTRDLVGHDYERLELRYFSQLHRVLSEPLTVRQADEVYRSEPYPDDGRDSVFLIWRWPSSPRAISSSAMASPTVR